MTLHIPSKTFLIGEYLALHQRPALVVATQPCFSMTMYNKSHNIEQSKESLVHNIHQQSPAGQLFINHHRLFNGLSLHFNDPHDGRGGFGASGAQFLGVYETIRKAYNKPFNQSHLAKTYRYYHNAGSGADIITQLYGQITVFKGLDKSPDIITWPFTNLGFMLVRTGFKLNTHDHINSSFDHLPFNYMNELVIQAVDAFNKKNEDQFIKAIESYSAILQNYNLVYDPVNPLIKSWQQYPGVLAVKGCGAMGADIIMILYKKSVFNVFHHDYVACETDLTDGLLNL